MYCQKCGTKNDDNAYRCSSCTAILQRALAGGAPAKIPNYLVQAILVTIFCCLPFGIVSIVYAAQVNGKIQAGDIAGAMEASKNAATWSWVSFGVGLVVGVIYILAMIGSASQS